MADHNNDPRQTHERQARVLKQLATASPDKHADPDHHAGSGENSIHLGTPEDFYGDAAGYGSIAIGQDARAVPVTDTESTEGVAIGSQATADGFGTTAVGARSYAQYETATAIGFLAFAGHAYSTALGHGAVSQAEHELQLGRGEDTVRIPGDLILHGSYSNPSSRDVKQNIIPAPTLRDLFPDLVEYEYIDGDGRRRLGYILQDLLGTDAERFVTCDRDGNRVGIDYLTLLIAQSAQLHARLAALENKVEG